jgi:thioredoxin-dependent peroxiredoxin
MKIALLSMLFGALPLKVGDRAPDFTLPDTEGKPVTLTKLLEKGPVILAFYPKAFTSGCTKQNQNFRDRFADVEAKGATVVGISTDSVETQKKFKTELKLPYELLSDEGGKVAKQYAGTMAVVGVANRANFVIGQDGLVKEIVAGGDAVDPTSAIAACPLRKKS